MGIKALTTFVQYGHFDKQIFTFTNSFSKTVDKAINTAALFICFHEAIQDRNVTGDKWDLAVSQT
jgi:hypothetical protein